MPIEGISGNDKICHLEPYKILELEQYEKPSFFRKLMNIILNW